MSQYLITFDMDTNCLKSDNYHGNNYNNAYQDIERILNRYGFTKIQGSVYLGIPEVSEAHGTLAIQELTATYSWFSTCVSNIKFYRIEADLDAQFIVDGVVNLKERFNQEIQALKKDLKAMGLTDSQIESIVSKRQFSLPQLDI
jgi:virulence-associated protein VapD